MHTKITRTNGTEGGGGGGALFMSFGHAFRSWGCLGKAVKHKANFGAARPSTLITNREADTFGQSAMQRDDV